MLDQAYEDRIAAHLLVLSRALGFKMGIDIQNRLGFYTLEVFATCYHRDAILDI